MKQPKAIIYDDNCPMCRWYTQAFVNTHLLEQEGRISFAELEQTELACKLDLDRSKHEIPLVDLEGGATIYGLDSLVHLLSPRFPFIKKVLRIKPIRYFFEKLYKLISYNRGIMAPSPPQKRMYDCTPDFNWKYRLVFIGLSAGIGFFLLSLFFSSWLLNGQKILFFVIPILLLMVAGYSFRGKTYITYLGHLAVVLAVCGLITLPAIVAPVLFPVCGAAAMTVFFWQYIRRFRLLKASTKML